MLIGFIDTLSMQSVWTAYLPNEPLTIFLISLLTSCGPETIKSENKFTGVIINTGSLRQCKSLSDCPIYNSPPGARNESFCINATN